MEDVKRAMSVEEAAKAAGVGRTILFEEIRKGHITARKVGRRTIITVDDLEAWLESLPRRSTEIAAHNCRGERNGTSAKTSSRNEQEVQG